jgi:hypothetical protein
MEFLELFKDASGGSGLELSLSLALLLFYIQLL